MSNEPERMHRPSWHGPNASESDHCPECIAFRRALATERRATVERIRARFNEELGVSVLVVKAMRMIMEDLDAEAQR